MYIDDTHLRYISSPVCTASKMNSKSNRISICGSRAKAPAPVPGWGAASSTTDTDTDAQPRDPPHHTTVSIWSYGDIWPYGHLIGS